MKTDFTTRQTKGGPNLPVKASPATEVVAGQTTVAAAGAPVRLYTSHILESGVYVKGLAGNGGNIIILHAEGAGSGYVLAAGESVFLEIDDLSKIWIDTDSAGDGACFVGS